MAGFVLREITHTMIFNGSTGVLRHDQAEGDESSSGSNAYVTEAEAWAACRKRVADLVGAPPEEGWGAWEQIGDTESEIGVGRTARGNAAFSSQAKQIAVVAE